MKIGALILAAGAGSRFNSVVPKQFHLLNGKKVYRHVLDTLISSKLFCSIGLVTKSCYHKHLHGDDSCTLIEGGDTRGASTFLGLKAFQDLDAIVICDGVRPFLTVKLLEDHIDQLKLGHVAVNTCIPCKDTINIGAAGSINSIPARETLLRGQTPQSFSFKELFDSHSKTKKTFTDDCGIMLEKGYPVSYVSGHETNIKITTSLDLEIASLLCEKDLTFSC